MMGKKSIIINDRSPLRISRVERVVKSRLFLYKIILKVDNKPIGMHTIFVTVYTGKYKLTDIQDKEIQRNPFSYNRQRA